VAANGLFASISRSEFYYAEEGAFDGALGTENWSECAFQGA
jgi:hypothetical protein